MKPDIIDDVLQNVYAHQLGWAKIKREFISKDQKEEFHRTQAQPLIPIIKEPRSSRKEREGSHRTDKENREANMSPTNPPKSPLISRSGHRDGNNNIWNFGGHGSFKGRKSMKLLVLGQDGVGKSAFTVRYLTRRFIGEYDPTLEGIFKKTTTIGRQEITIEIKDTSKGVNWSKRGSDFLWADALILMYSITCKESFDELQNIAKLLEQHKHARDLPCLVIGNKKDLAHERTVTFLEGNKLATSLDGIFCEVSVSDNYIDLEGVVNHFIKEHFTPLRSPMSQSLNALSLGSESLRAKSTSDLHKKDPESSDTENKQKIGKALWQKLRTSNDIKKSKGKLST